MVRGRAPWLLICLAIGLGAMAPMVGRAGRGPVISKAPSSRMQTQLDPTIVRLYSGRVTGFSSLPGGQVDLRLRAPDGRIIAWGRTHASESAKPDRPAGYFEHRFSDERLSAGDRIEIDTRSGDPEVIEIPELVAVASPRENTLSGAAPPGTSIDLTIMESDGSGPFTPTHLDTVRADPSGRFELELGGAHALQIGDWGTADMTLGSGTRVIAAWAALGLTWSPDQGLHGRGALAGETVSVTLRSPEGTIRGSYEEEIDGSGTSWWDTSLRDSAGQLVRERPGDVFRVVSGSSLVTFTIPSMSLLVFPDTDELSGTAPRGERVQLVVRSAATNRQVQADVRADENGNFTHSFANDLDFAYNDRATASIKVGDIHTAYIAAHGPGVTLYLDTSTVTGSQAPNSTVNITQMRDGQAVGEVRTRSDHRGRYSGIVQSTAGGRSELRHGDSLVIDAAGSPVMPQLTLDVPELSIVASAQDRSLRGRATRGGVLSVSVTEEFNRTLLPQENLVFYDAAILPNGEWVVDLLAEGTSGPDFRPGQSFTASYRMPSGHRAYRSQTLPLVNIHHGGASICGFSDPGRLVSIVVQRNGSDVGHAEAEADAAGRFEARLRTNQLEDVRTRAGDMISVAFGSAFETLELPVHDIFGEWSVPMENRNGVFTRLGGRSIPDSDYYITSPGDECWSGGEPQPRVRHYDGRTRQDGTFQRDVPTIDVGAAVQVAGYSTRGHRFYRQLRRTQLQAHVYTDLVRVSTVAHADVSVVLVDAAGEERGKAHGVSDAQGVVRLELRSEADAPVSMLPRDELAFSVVRSDGVQESGSTEIEGLSFDFSSSKGLLGSAPARRDVRVSLSLISGPHLEFVRTSNANRIVRYGPEDVPAEANWNLGDVNHVRLTVDDAAGHQMVTEGRVDPEGLRPFLTDVFLPLATR